MEEYKLINENEIFDDELLCEYKDVKVEDYEELLNDMSLEAEERAEIESEEDAESTDLFDEDVNEVVMKTAEDWYFAYIVNKNTFLPKEEQYRLLKIYHTTEDEKEKNKARDELLKTNQLLIVSIAKKYKIRGIDLDDLIQEGNMGLMKAIDKYDISTNYALSTYATHWIRVYIGRYIQQHGSAIRIPVNMLDKIYKFRRIISEYQRKGEKIPSEIELAKLIDCDKTQISNIICYSNIIETISMSTPLKGSKEGFGEGIEIKDTIPAVASTPADGYENYEVVKGLHEEMKLMFDERTYDILCRRYGMNEYLEPQTLEDIGKFYGISKERVRQIQERAEGKISESDNIKILIKK